MFRRDDSVEIGSTRLVKRFLLLPRYYNGEFRWLEYAWIIERAIGKDGFGMIWIEVGFAEKGE